MELIKTRLKRAFTVRPNTDLQAEILNIVIGPIYVYTITTVFYYSLFYTLPYHYGGKQTSTSVSADEHDQPEVSWTIWGHKMFLAMVYFQMMSNWLCIRFVDNSLKTASKYSSSTKSRKEYGDLTSLVVVSDEWSVRGNGPISNGNVSTNQKHSLIPDPSSAPPPQKKKQSYWSWRFCWKCNLNAPPRCHHCPMCETCVLKRDHHCFFTRRCIGFYNQRHFIVFLVWAVLGTSHSTLHFIPYFYRVLYPTLSVFDLFPPFALLHWLFGSGSFHVTNTMFSFVFNAMFILMSSGFAWDQCQLVAKGITQFEEKGLNRNKITVTDPRQISDKIRAVMGFNYGLAFLFPLSHLFYPPHENPLEWPEHKIYKR